jgi:hypothetical protein
VLNKPIDNCNDVLQLKQLPFVILLLSGHRYRIYALLLHQPVISVVNDGNVNVRTSSSIEIINLLGPVGAKVAVTPPSNDIHFIIALSHRLFLVIMLFCIVRC